MPESNAPANPQGPIGAPGRRPLGDVTSPNTPRLPGPQGPATPGALESVQAPLGPSLPGYSEPHVGVDTEPGDKPPPGRDVIDQVAAYLSSLLGGGRRDLLPSAAPGGGPSAEREGPKAGGGAGGEPPEGPVRGDSQRALGGYGGMGDPIGIVDPPKYTREALQQLIDVTARTRAPDQLRSRFRFQIPYSPEGHNQDGWRFIAGPYARFAATTAAVIATGSNNQTLAFPLGTAGPFVLLDRYPQPLYVSLYVRSFTVTPTGTTMTGLLDCYFTDPGGAVVSLGVYNAATINSGLQTIGVLCNTPITDPGTPSPGVLHIDGITIGGTAVTARYSLDLGYVAMVPDPWFQHQQLRPPTPAQQAAQLRAVEGITPIGVTGRD